MLQHSVLPVPCCELFECGRMMHKRRFRIAYLLHILSTIFMCVYTSCKLRTPLVCCAHPNNWAHNRKLYNKVEDPRAERRQSEQCTWLVVGKLFEIVSPPNNKRPKPSKTPAWRALPHSHTLASWGPEPAIGCWCDSNAWTGNITATVTTTTSYSY